MSNSMDSEEAADYLYQALFSGSKITKYEMALKYAMRAAFLIGQGAEIPSKEDVEAAKMMARSSQLIH